MVQTTWAGTATHLSRRIVGWIVVRRHSSKVVLADLRIDRAKAAWWHISERRRPREALQICAVPRAKPAATVGSPASEAAPQPSERPMTRCRAAGPACTAPWARGWTKRARTESRRENLCREAGPCASVGWKTYSCEESRHHPAVQVPVPVERGHPAQRLETTESQEFFDFVRGLWSLRARNISTMLLKESYRLS